MLTGGLGHFMPAAGSYSEPGTQQVPGPWGRDVTGPSSYWAMFHLEKGIL